MVEIVRSVNRRSLFIAIVIAGVLAGCGSPGGDGAAESSVSSDEASTAASVISKAYEESRKLSLDTLIGRTLADARREVAQTRVQGEPEVYRVPDQSGEPARVADVNSAGGLMVTAVYLDGESQRLYFGVASTADIDANEYVRKVVAAKSYDLTMDLERIAGISKPSPATTLFYK